MDFRIEINRHIFGLLCAVLACTTPAATAQDIMTITHGEQVDINSHVVPGKLTVFDFYADWCGPCRSLTPALERLAAANPDDFAVRKVDIINFGSDVANQYRIQSIPHLKLFDRNGGLVAEGNAGQVMRILTDRLGGGLEVGMGRSLAPMFILGGLGALTLFLVLRGRSSHQPGVQPLAPPAPSREVTSSGWFIMMQNSLEGPFAEEDLEDMLRRREISGQAKTRRRGQSTWTTVDQVVEHLK